MLMPETAQKLTIAPISLRDAREFVTQIYRHHRAPQGGKFAISVVDGASVRGVVIVGRPVARKLDDGYTAEVTRCATDGARNACSMLYRAAWRTARGMGYTRVITYTLASETGASLRGAGFRCLGQAGGGNWNVPSRSRIDTAAQLSGQKLLWEA